MFTQHLTQWSIILAAILAEDGKPDWGCVVLAGYGCV
jgi:hypothetical protein